MLDKFTVVAGEVEETPKCLEVLRFRSYQHGLDFFRVHCNPAPIDDVAEIFYSLLPEAALILPNIQAVNLQDLQNLVEVLQMFIPRSTINQQLIKKKKQGRTNVKCCRRCRSSKIGKSRGHS